jgi:hypothetical protein
VRSRAVECSSEKEVPSNEMYVKVGGPIWMSVASKYCDMPAGYNPNSLSGLY